MKRERVDDDGAMDSDSDEPQGNVAKRARAGSATEVCPWLGTVDRTRLDFDFEKLCSVSLQNANVYACLVCGKVYFLPTFSAFKKGWRGCALLLLRLTPSTSSPVRLPPHVPLVLPRTWSWIICLFSQRRSRPPCLSQSPNKALLLPSRRLRGHRLLSERY